MVDNLDSVKNILSNHSYPSDISAYSIGSIERGCYDSRISDVDVLIIDHGTSLSGRVNHFMAARGMYRTLKKEYGTVDAFFLGEKTLSYYLTYVPVISDRHELNARACIVGDARNYTYNDTFSMSLRRRVYVAEANKRIRQLQTGLLVANTQYARKHAKYLLRSLKIILCASTNGTDLTEFEKELFKCRTFLQVATIAKKKASLTVRSNAVFDQILQNQHIDDWGAWMTAQQTLIEEISALPIASEDIPPGDIFEQFSYLLREMLVARVKDVLSQDNDTEMLRLAAIFVDDTASILAKFALMDVGGLTDFDSNVVPKNINTAYKAIVAHLQNGQIGVGTFVNAVVILEYALAKVHLDMCRKV